MCDPFTPSTEGVRAAYATDGSTWDVKESEAEFDRWFAEMEHEIRATALRAFRQELIADQIERYGIVLPDIHEVIDALEEAADV